MSNPVWAPDGRVGDYRLQQELGSGGMGAVYAVRHSPTGAERALKVSTATDDKAVERFLREARAMASLDGHPHVVRVHEAGNVGGVLFLIMDRASGGDLASRLRGGPLPADEARTVAAQLASGLAHVHARGLLHRDLKPDNVLFSEDGRAQLVDFGLVRSVDGSSLTQTGEVLGTPSYMAPEQANGRRELDGRTDVYGLGAILYHMLTGRPPFEGAALLSVLQKVIKVRPERPSKLAQVPPALEAICLRALAKDPAQRFESAEALGRALEEADLAAGGAPRWWIGGVAAGVLLAGVSAAAFWPGEAESEPAPVTESLEPVATQEADPPAPPEPEPEEVQVPDPDLHPLDRFLQTLPPPLEDDVLLAEVDPQTRTMIQSGHGMKNREARKLAAIWLKRQGRVQEALALYAAWAREGDGSAWNYMADMFGSERIAKQLEIPLTERVVFVRECDRRGAEAGDLEAVLAFASRVLQREKNPVEALALYRRVEEQIFRTGTSINHRSTWHLGMAQVAAYFPGTPGRASDEEALEYIAYVLQYEDRAGPPTRKREEAELARDRIQGRVAKRGPGK